MENGCSSHKGVRIPTAQEFPLCGNSVLGMTPFNAADRPFVQRRREMGVNRINECHPRAKPVAIRSPARGKKSWRTAVRFIKEYGFPRQASQDAFLGMTQ